MFTQPFLVMDLVDVHPRAINGEEDKRAVDLVFKLSPFTPALARQLGTTIDVVLFDDDGVERKGLKSATFIPTAEPQRVKFGPNDLPKPEIELARVDVTEIVVKPQTDAAGYVCTVRAGYEFPTESDLLKLTNGLGRKHFVSWADEDPSLLPKEEPAPKTRKTKEKSSESAGMVN